MEMDENCPFTDDVPMKPCHVPWSCCQLVDDPTAIWQRLSSPVLSSSLAGADLIKFHTQEIAPNIPK
jgi:hypothetical protein